MAAPNPLVYIVACNVERRSAAAKSGDCWIRTFCRGVEMPKLAIIGNLEIASGHLDRVLPLLMAHRARCLADEPGTLQFEVLLPRDDQTKVLLYEVYTDDAAFEAHWSGPSTNRLREEAAGMIVGVTGTRCALAD
jgi:(4S)-4-hydroxy-5-phosphonooxypentane-2,3-dione isomerase